MTTRAGHERQSGQLGAERVYVLPDRPSRAAVTLPAPQAGSITGTEYVIDGGSVPTA